MKVKVKCVDCCCCVPHGLLKCTPWVKGKVKKIKAFIRSEWVEDLDKVDWGDIWWCARCNCSVSTYGGYPRKYKFCPECNAKMY